MRLNAGRPQRSILSMNEPSSAWRRASAISDDRVRQEARIVAGDRTLVLADREPARDVVDPPAAEHGILAVEIAQRRERLADEALAAIRPLLLRQRHALADQ